ncbi:MAG: class III extradiol ring-cleavage dioxygenase [Rhodospirillales bacterium]
MTRNTRQPTFYIPHGGGPCFFMDDPNGQWSGMAAFLKSIPGRLRQRPRAIVAISGHWETVGFAFTGAAHPALVFDYYGFPEHTYHLRYDAPGDPALALKATRLLQEAGLTASVDPSRGFDHGVFIPFKVAFPGAAIPVVEMSLDRSLDPALHLAAGRALVPLRDEGVLIVATGMSFHNMRGYGDPRFTAPSEQFDAWLTQSLTADAATRVARLKDWESAPAARLCHPEAEHFLPLMVAAGAADGPAEKLYGEHVLKTAISGFRFE